MKVIKNLISMTIFIVFCLITVGLSDIIINKYNIVEHIWWLYFMSGSITSIIVNSVEKELDDYYDQINN